MKPLSPTAETQVRTVGEELYLNSILMSRCCVIERFTLQVVLRCRSFKLVKIPSFDCKIPLWCVLTEKWQLRWIYRFFGGRLGLLQLRDCKGCCVWRRLWAWVVLGNVIGSVAWQNMAVALDQTNWKVLVKRAHYIKSLNVVTTNCSTFWNQKLWCGTLFPKKKKWWKQTCSLKHINKKGIWFWIWAN